MLGDPEGSVSLWRAAVLGRACTQLTVQPPSGGAPLYR